MTDTRKTPDALKREYDGDREMYGKTFHHRKTQEDYQLLFPAFHESTNEKLAVYCLCSQSWSKFICPFDKFIESFIEGSATTARETAKATENA